MPETPSITSHPQSELTFRPAVEADQKTIVAIIREAGINPMSLKWPNFLLAVDEATGEIVGTGQIKTHGDGSRELASIATQPAYQGRGIAREIIRRLIAKDVAESTDPLYLTCVSTMGTFYEPFGFRVVERLEDMPPYFRRVKRIVGVIRWIARRDETLLVMRRDRDAP